MDYDKLSQPYILKSIYAEDIINVEICQVIKNVHGEVTIFGP